MSTVPTQTPVKIEIGGSIAHPDHPSHGQAILAAIMAGLQAFTSLAVVFLPPKVSTGLLLGEALEPTVVNVIQAIKEAPTSK